MSQEQEPTTETRSRGVTKKTADIVEVMAKQIHRWFCTVGEFEACQNYYCIESRRELGLLRSLVVQETPIPQILKEFDVMTLAHHDAAGHEARNISICHDEVCRKRLQLRNELEQLLAGSPSTSRYQPFLANRWNRNIVHPAFDWVVVDTVENLAMSYTNSKLVAESWALQLNTKGYITEVEIHNS